MNVDYYVCTCGARVPLVSATDAMTLFPHVCPQTGAEIERLRELERLVRTARAEGWYEDNPGWGAVDRLLRDAPDQPDEG